MIDRVLYWHVFEGDPEPPTVKTIMYADIESPNVNQRIAHGVVDAGPSVGVYTPINRDEIAWWAALPGVTVRMET